MFLCALFIFYISIVQPINCRNEQDRMTNDMRLFTPLLAATYDSIEFRLGAQEPLAKQVLINLKKLYAYIF